MTNLSQAKEAVYARFVADFSGTGNIVFENEEPPFETDAETEWVRLTVRHTAREQDTLGAVGNRRYRTTASVFVQVYTRADVGVKQGDVLATEAKDVFEGVSFSGLDFNNGIVREMGVSGKLYQHIVEVVFQYDETK